MKTNLLALLLTPHGRDVSRALFSFPSSPYANSSGLFTFGRLLFEFLYQE
jgi:hypothetical protein